MSQFYIPCLIKTKNSSEWVKFANFFWVSINTGPGFAAGWFILSCRKARPITPMLACSLISKAGVTESKVFDTTPSPSAFSISIYHPLPQLGCAQFQAHRKLRGAVCVHSRRAAGKILGLFFLNLQACISFEIDGSGLWVILRFGMRIRVVVME